MMNLLARPAWPRGARAVELPGGQGSEQWLAWDGGAIAAVRRSVVSTTAFGVTARHLTVLRITSGGRGLAVALADGTGWPGAVPDTLLLPPGCTLRGRAQGEIAFVAAMIGPLFLRRAVPEVARLRMPVAPVLGGLDEGIGMLLDMAAAYCRQGDPTRIAAARALAQVLCVEVLARHADLPAPAETQGTLPAWRLQRLDALIGEKLGGPIRLSELAASVGLSLHHFARSFRRTRGQTPQAYIQTRRVARARELMAGTSRPLSDIATACGFTSQSHFTTVFRKVEGVTPGRWRHQAASRGAEGMRDAAE